MNSNEMHLSFTQMDVENNTFHNLLTVSSDKEKVLRTFALAKKQFQSKEQTDCIIDLLDSNHDIIDDCSVTYRQMSNLADLLGFELGVPNTDDINTITPVPLRRVK